MTEPITWRQVPGWFNFDDIYQEAVDRAPARDASFIEIGVLFAKSTLFMAEAISRSGKQIAFNAVDIFACSPRALEDLVQKYRERCPNSDHSRLDELLALAGSLGHMGAVEHVIELSGLRRFVDLHRSRGQDHAGSHPDASLDFVYVDALHTYDDTAQILKAFLPKMRPGSIIAGHDYEPSYNGVVDAVRDVLGKKVEVRRLSFIWTKP